MNLVVDYGNTSAKVAIFDHQKMLEKYSFKVIDELQQFLQKSNADKFIISSVNADANHISNWAIHVKQKLVLTSALPLPITILYSTPNTLGVDRIAGVCGARQLFPNTDCLVIDAGTCITYDFIDASGNYHGGSISPGMMIRFKSVHTFTAKLPLVNPTEQPELVGHSTETSIQSGVIHGVAAEIDGIIDRYQKKYPQLQVILCGGDATFFENKLKEPIFASPDLVLLGLNSVLIHHESIK